MKKNIFIKFHEDNEDYPEVYSTMAEHQNIAELGNGEFIWGQFTTRANQKGISKIHKSEIDQQLTNGEKTNIYFYSRVGKLLYKAELLEVYNNTDNVVTSESFKELVPSYYRHLCGITNASETHPSYVYAFFRVRNLELLANNMSDIEEIATSILHYDRQVPILTVKGMQALYYVSDDKSETKIKRFEVKKLQKDVSNKNPKFVQAKQGSEERTWTTRQVDHEAASEVRRKNGLLAELIVVKEEESNLIRNGREDLAKKVCHVSVEEGDGAGYDIRSYDLLGNLKEIEVKGTESVEDKPFFVSESEVARSKETGDKYYLYRVYDLKSENPKIKVYRGDLEEHFDLQELSYIARPKN